VKFKPNFCRENPRTLWPALQSGQWGSARENGSRSPKTDIGRPIALSASPDPVLWARASVYLKFAAKG
jgi:hypothetical protein